MTWFHFQKSAAEERLHNLTAQYSEQSQEVRIARRSAEEKEAQVAKKQLRIRQLQEACDVACSTTTCNSAKLIGYCRVQVGEGESTDRTSPSGPYVELQNCRQQDQVTSHGMSTARGRAGPRE